MSRDKEKQPPLCRVCRGASQAPTCRECEAWDVTLRHVEAVTRELRELRS